MRSALNFIQKLTDYLGRASAGFIVIIAILLMYEVFMRYVINKPADWVLDITQLTQAAFAFCAASYVLKIGGHVGMNLVTEFVGKETRRWLAIICNSITTLGCAWMVFLTWGLFEKSYKIREACYGVDLPIYPWKILVPFCFLMLSLQCLALLIDNILARPEDFAEVKGE